MYTVDEIIEIITNGGPKLKNHIKDPCGICGNSVKNEHKAICCDNCSFWIHIKCNNTLDKEYEFLKTSDEMWSCIICKIKFNLGNFPFTTCDNIGLDNLQNVNSMSFLESLPSANIVNETIQFATSINEINNELPTSTSCKYYSVKDFQDEIYSKNLNIFHTNINGLGSKIDNLSEFLTSSEYKIDVVAVTETSEFENVGFIKNVEIDGYKQFNTASKTSKGGTCIYVKSNLNYLERTDLNIMNEEFESTWIEIKNKNSKNIITGSIYRHPHYNFNEFLKYLENCLSKLAKEDKEIYVCGDFNFDLLKNETEQHTQTFSTYYVAMDYYLIFSAYKGY